MQFEVPTSATVVVRKQARVVDGIDTWPQASLAKVFAYGLQQLANDAAAPAKTPAEIESFVTKRLDNLAAGVLRATSTRLGDPVEREAVRIAREMVLGALRKKGIAPKGQPIAELVTKLLAKQPAIREQAKANVAGNADLGNIEVEV